MQYKGEKTYIELGFNGTFSTVRLYRALKRPIDANDKYTTQTNFIYKHHNYAISGLSSKF